MALFGRAKRTERRGSEFDFLIVGLGNPGTKYSRTRHNVGFEAIELLATRLNATLKAGRDRALFAEVNTTANAQTKHLLLAMPTTFMNESGNAVGPLARRYAISDPLKIIIVHDELDLEPGVVKIKSGGGLAGHNGLASITQHLKTQDFLRVRIGVGKPPSKEQGGDHVLSKIPARERELLDISVQVAADAVQLIVAEGLDAAMRNINAR
ncbi:MAG: aminoacyl-tRNA hydrolase [Ilumatobacteraceae bacterium]|jgi:PTH1 family peptidyl-tRNA hydrolase|nr:aminoacyl-tRNA hydrolase [Actinomycetota bacterium]MDP4635772.1 aminoacyl-tRNA hydrolase [Ilumatobacteraceae bacterium]MDA2983193.1 aminoacyl-tRNA hydrolase [Actinomycetota bacterium]MDA3041997.1 aminoacyl-tRNA hydrolase [Actinomycetota bacterium]MDP4696012.1 aminoacyl-tRNA hydrolase [Ilumatobacteraceae bacterium]